MTLARKSRLPTSKVEVENNCSRKLRREFFQKENSVEIIECHRGIHHIRTANCQTYSSVEGAIDLLMTRNLNYFVGKISLCDWLDMSTV